MSKQAAAGRSADLTNKRERFEEAGKFPWKKLALIGALTIVVLVGAMVGYQQWQKSKEVAGPSVAGAASYPSDNLKQIDGIPLEVGASEVSFSLADLKKNWIIGMSYPRETPLPEGYKLAGGGEDLPLLAYIAPNGNVVVATSFCEPCRSWTFHIEGESLVCDVCFTRWDLTTLQGQGGGCMDYPPEVVTAEVRGDRVVLPKAELEAWAPRAYQQ